MRILIIEAHSGISGDMFVAAAAKLAGCELEVRDLPRRLGLPGVTCGFRDVLRGSIQCRKFDVMEGGHSAEEAPHSHHHSHGHAHPHDSGHSHAEDHAPHDHGHDGSHAHEHRALSQILAMIEAADLERPVAECALRMFRRLGEVEAAAHGIPIERVHFHEVGAVDSIVDIVAAALCMERLAIGAAFATPICVGSGTVRTAHGILPVPAPATERLLRGMPTVTGDLSGEWTTPTGALILDELGVRFGIPECVTTDAAFGGGTRNPETRLSVLRLRLAETQQSAVGVERDELVVISCNIDDSPAELCGATLLDTLIQAGARDAVIRPVLMKKGRPGHQLEVLVPPDLAETMALRILSETSTIGVRMNPVRRIMLPREACVIRTAHGAIAAKSVRLPDGRCRITPEFESCLALAAEKGLAVQDVYLAALRGAGDPPR